MQRGEPVVRCAQWSRVFRRRLMDGRGAFRRAGRTLSDELFSLRVTQSRSVARRAVRRRASVTTRADQ